LTWILQRVTHIEITIDGMRYLQRPAAAEHSRTHCRSWGRYSNTQHSRHFPLAIAHRPQSSITHSCMPSSFYSHSTKSCKYSICKCSDHPTVNVRESRRGRLVGKSVHLFSRKPGTEEDPLCLTTKITLSKPP